MYGLWNNIYSLLIIFSDKDISTTENTTVNETKVSASNTKSKSKSP